MKLLFPLILLLSTENLLFFFSGPLQSTVCVVIIMIICLPDVQPLKGEQKMKTYQSFVLRFKFEKLFKNNEKYCCKLSSRCDKLLDSTGFTTESLAGRVEIKNGDGWIEFRIINVQPEDAGLYRCVVMGFQQHAYQDFKIKLFGECNHVQTSLLPVRYNDFTTVSTEVTPTFKPSTRSATLPQSTAAAEDGDLRDDRRYPLG